jgi:hypothetical protein
MFQLLIIQNKKESPAIAFEINKTIDESNH